MVFATRSGYIALIGGLSVNNEHYGIEPGDGDSSLLSWSVNRGSVNSPGQGIVGTHEAPENLLVLVLGNTDASIIQERQ